MSPKERHDRLVKTIAGYPDIDVATRPLDWSLHPYSVKAMRTSLAIDDLPGIDPETSLRSTILNVDSNFRSGPESADPENNRWGKLSAKCLGLLFASIAATRRAKEALLISLSSYDNVAGIEKIWRMSFEEEEDVPPFSPDPGPGPNQPDPIKTPYKEHPEVWDEYKEHQKLDGEYEKYKPYESNEMDWLVTFQFYRVQTWMKELLVNDRGDGTVQRVLRGASLILESAISEIRNFVMTAYGPGSIVIDGGGRLRVSVPTEEEAEKLKAKLLKLYEEFLTVGSSKWGDSDVPRQTASRLERELECWWNSLEISQQIKDAKAALRSSEEFPPGYESQIKRGYIKSFALTGLPPRRVDITRIGHKIDIEDEDQLLEALNLWGEPPSIQDSDFKVDSCPFLNGNLSEKLSAVIVQGPDKGEIKKNKWTSVDDWIFERKSKIRHEYKEDYGLEIEVNPVHRLLYILGHYQRMKDSVLHRPQRNSRNKEFFKTELEDRAVLALVKLDGNSVGQLFGMNKMDRVDIVRRRSFRFNAHWWYALHSAMDELDFDGGDPVGAWLVAGDDVLLAEYRHAGDPDSSILMSVLEGLSGKIQTGINVELRAASNDNQIYFSFGAGYSRKEDHLTGHNRIRSMMESVDELEESASKHWKYEIGVKKREYWMVSDSKKVEEPPESPEGKFISDNVSDYLCQSSPDFCSEFFSPEEISAREINNESRAGRKVKIEWPEEGNWTMSDLNSAKKEIGLKPTDSHNSKELFEILTRCETKDEITRVLLKP
jgi:hypothetical protein